ncbi:MULTISPECIES: hypothetical protein [unclassified Tolypothrix]|uniref:hypothetical protein n=1 Tax=unclassified Tolypothrix TaxID=2649714 RepID=UPI0005EAAA02|nr:MULTISPECIES: hypothetical protein [unclassified Tolypothrix]BAY95286.1 hypothetical protein NIES3275_73430 [Microchaete diplosiphon NIES-3275]EKE98276.1 hypothetical protein FDUTEX481_04431 [Tolypothrix sp. PCC 7601]MBE9084004.1 hypothetical protein [Tolypothrix sp. LEGE 11397]UYD30508.1 hypothetical protein HGR01_37380 [Tolypothrix sp. PCC 7712]UYD38358.1 hypothetical protein HG267_37510 [Tolypothrix sp. PCC 7601]
MLNKILGIRLLILAGLLSSSVVAALLISPEITIGQTKSQVVSWTGIFDWLIGKKKQRPISRPQEGLCLITPNGKIYSTNPMFIWQGNLKEIAVSKARNQKNFWHQKVTNPETLAVYQGEQALQPGSSYDWKGFLGENPTIVAKFQVMGTQERQQITDELKALEQRLQTQGADEKTIALEKADFFAKHELWSDVLQQVYSVPNLAKELPSQTKDLLKQLCEDK